MKLMRASMKRLVRRFPAIAVLIHKVRQGAARPAAPGPTQQVPAPVVPMPTLSKAEADAHLIALLAADAGAGIGSRANGRDVLMLVVSDLRIDPRVQREARALADAGYRVTVACPSPFSDVETPPEIDWGPGVEILYVSVVCGNYVGEWPGFLGGQLYDVLARTMAGRSCLAVHSHDLNTAYVGLALAQATGAHFVADFHEWTSENVHWDVPTSAWAPYPDSWKVKLQALEGRVMRQASAVVTVCDSIADSIAQELGDGRRPEVIRNIPPLSAEVTRAYPPLKEQCGLATDRFVLLWQGGTGPTRLIEPIIEALAFTPRCTLVIRGPSLHVFGADYRAIAERIGAGDRLILMDPVPSRDVVAAARGADAGIWTLPRLCRNFTYALPNKIFEYIASELALLVADYPEARRMVETHGVGLTFDPYDPKSIAAAINRLIDEPSFANGLRLNSARALKTIDSDAEWQKLVALYDALPRCVAA